MLLLGERAKVTNIQASAEIDTRPCPLCAETIKNAAVKCKHCGADVVVATAAQPTQSESSSKIFYAWTVRISTHPSDLPAEEQLLRDLGISVMEIDGDTIITGPFDSERSAKAVSFKLGDKHNLHCHMYSPSAA